MIVILPNQIAVRLFSNSGVFIYFEIETTLFILLSFAYLVTCSQLDRCFFFYLFLLICFCLSSDVYLQMFLFIFSLIIIVHFLPFEFSEIYSMLCRCFYIFLHKKHFKFSLLLCYLAISEIYNCFCFQI